MTEKDIVKALGFCKRDAYYTRCNSKCPLIDYCESDEESEMNICGLALDLINRQKAEIEKLKADNKKMFDKWEILDNATKQYYADLYADSIEAERAEAIKEFAKELKENLRLEDDCDYDCASCFYECKEYVPNIDILVKEITEGDNNA